MLGQILAYILPMKYFLDVTNIYNQLMYSKGDCLGNMVGFTQSVENLKSKN